MDEVLLSSQRLTIGYRHGATRRPVAERLSFEIFKNELVCLLGPNGAGKSTLLKTVAGLLPPLDGEIKLQDKPLTHFTSEALAKARAVVLTDPIEGGHLSVFELASLGRFPFTGVFGGLTAVDRERVTETLKWVGALELSQRPFGELSDGEKQRVLIARALAQEPSLLVLDEPTAFLDLPYRLEIFRLLRKLARMLSRAVIVSTHDLNLALQTADRLLLLPQGGPLISGVPEDLVLGGAFDHLFPGRSATFDAESGDYVIPTPKVGQMAVSGRGMEARWTARALERVGYSITDSGTTPSRGVSVENTGEGSVWRVDWEGKKRDCMSIEEMLRFIHFSK